MNNQSDRSSIDNVSQTTTTTQGGSAVQRELITASWAAVGSLIEVTVDSRVFKGRIFCYDYSSKTLVLSKLRDFSANLFLRASP